MKRDRRLHGLTSDHHQGLVLARRIAQGELDAAAVRVRFDAELAPHFLAEEELLLPALDAAEPALVARTRRDHADLRAHLAAAERGEPGRLVAFAVLLDAHIRFEERDLFPAAETHVPSDALDRVEERKPHTRPRPRS